MQLVQVLCSSCASNKSHDNAICCPIYTKYTVFIIKNIYIYRYRERELGNECAVCAVCAPAQQLLPPNQPPSATCGPCCPQSSQQFLLLDKGKVSIARGAAPPPEDAADPVPTPPTPLGQKAGGSKGARPPSPEVQEPGGSWRIFAYFLYARK